MNIINIYISEKIKNLRNERKITQEKLAENLNCSRITIVNIEGGRHSLTLKRLYKVANFFDEELTYFLPDRKWVQENKNKKVKKIVTFEFYD